jgi:hypothetical protein
MPFSISRLSSTSSAIAEWTFYQDEFSISSTDCSNGIASSPDAFDASDIPHVFFVRRSIFANGG